MAESITPLGTVVYHPEFVPKLQLELWVPRQKGGDDVEFVFGG